MRRPRRGTGTELFLELLSEDDLGLSESIEVPDAPLLCEAFFLIKRAGRILVWVGRGFHQQQSANVLASRFLDAADQSRACADSLMFRSDGDGEEIEGPLGHALRRAIGKADRLLCHLYEQPDVWCLPGEKRLGHVVQHVRGEKAGAAKNAANAIEIAALKRADREVIFHVV